MTDKSNNQFKRNEVKGQEVYQFLSAYFLHQDALSWSRVQTIVAIEAAVLAGSYAIRDEERVLAAALLAAGFLLTLLIVMLMWRDWQIRDHVQGLLDHVHKPRGIRLSPEPSCLSGRDIVLMVLPILLVIHVALGVYYACRLQI